MLREMAEDAGHRVDDRVAAAGEGEVRESHQLAPRERPVAEAGFDEQAEEVVPGLRVSEVEALVQVGIESAGLRFPVWTVKHVHAPGDPAVGLGLRHVEEHGQGPRLQRQRELRHHLRRLASQRLADQPVDDRPDAGGIVRRAGPEEERLDEGPVVGVVWRIGLDRQLAIRPQRLLRRDRHAVGRVGTEGLPVPCRPANILVPQEHRDRLARIDDRQHAVVLSLRSEWV